MVRSTIFAFASFAATAVLIAASAPSPILA